MSRRRHLPPNLQSSIYLGDGVYAAHDDYHVWLYIDNGVEITDIIALEPQVLAALRVWLIKCSKSV
jgi:hypothetical protein